MAPIAQPLQERFQALQDELTARVERGPTEQLTAFLKEYRTGCEEIILRDFELATVNHFEDKLWDAILAVNNLYRNAYRKLKRPGTNRVVEARKFGKQYLTFLKDSTRFYRGYILHLDAQVDGGILELRKIAQKLSSGTAAQREHARIPAHMTPNVVASCHKSLVHLGDLSRYRESELVEKEKRNWGPAVGYYTLASEINPDSGLPHNQLAVIAREDSDQFRSIYHLYRSLACKLPPALGEDNIRLAFKKVLAAWDKGEVIAHRKSDGCNAGQALIAWFIRLHSKCFKGEEFSQHDELENEVLSHLAIELKERSLDSILHKIVLINLAAEYFSTAKMQSENPPENILRTYFYFLRLNVKTFFTLLQILQPELERLSDGDDVTRGADHTPQLSDKITAVARRILPALRLYSAWFSETYRVLCANVADTLTEVEVTELWKAYAGTLTLLASGFPAGELPEDQYMLEEDCDTIGFQPLAKASRLWYYGDSQKPKGTELERSHPNIEMLMRIRDLLTDGLHLVQAEDAPLELVGLRFVHREAGLPSESLASPAVGPGASPMLSSEPIILPIPSEVQRLPEDQTSQTPAPSETASTVQARDTAMKSMVDDLVGPEDGLGPLPEEDETVLPTPPEQTFEDTVVSTNENGVTTFSISDLVNSVHNYKRAAVTPTPASPLHAAPMERGPSSSSIRHTPTLPSLPDGQGNGGNSIWNTRYNGTAGASSPLFGNSHYSNGGQATNSQVNNGHSSYPYNDMRGSPLNGVHLGPTGHVRGDSSVSIRSSDWGMSSGTPVQRNPPPGLGYGATWGNPAPVSYPAYGYDYGNNHVNKQVNMTDVNLASPVLFGMGSRSSGLHSSYARTPPNGQAG